ncbi:carbon storage regulator [Kyrpidia spormannii]|uniref:Translational regulator CsrA (Modular protein) n=2 Tax=Kyrpidia spormannii TaxID=2055160 RepID=A0ACA8ZCW3_9BACL|nr:carbon storage regulator [Kyrpidia spormannii]CAB3395128.1 Translational regulator CsrA (modular protein) [Kyrpidia spormannii]CAB3395994.1 Translational regulator CsrA (modular protein) [Kyrpidia spormannii]
MLVLSRRVGEAVFIGEDVRVLVLEVRGDLECLGIKAPRSVPVNREAVFEQIREENRRAAKSTAAADRLFVALGSGPEPEDGPGPGSRIPHSISKTPATESQSLNLDGDNTGHKSGEQTQRPRLLPDRPRSSRHPPPDDPGPTRSKYRRWENTFALKQSAAPADLIK